MIETERLIIRNFKPDDAEDLFEYLSLPETYIWEPGEPVTKEQAEKLALERSRGNSFWAVVLRKSDKMIGHLYFSRIPPEHFRTWELGYIFNPLYQRMGFGTEASRAIVEYGFRYWNIHRVVANCSIDNIASWRLLEKAGLTREGHFRKKAFFRRDAEDNPMWFDSYHYAVLNPDE